VRAVSENTGDGIPFAPKAGEAFFPQIFFNCDWSFACGHYFWNNDIGANLMCAQLGFLGGGVIVRKPDGDIDKTAVTIPRWIGECSAQSTDLAECGLVRLPHTEAEYIRKCQEPGETPGFRVRCFDKKPRPGFCELLRCDEATHKSYFQVARPGAMATGRAATIDRSACRPEKSTVQQDNVSGDRWTLRSGRTKCPGEQVDFHNGVRTA
jgi:hypothetical protein